MRQAEIKELLAQALTDRHELAAAVQRDKGRVEFQNLRRFRNFVRSVSQIPVFADAAKELESADALQTPGETSVGALDAGLDLLHKARRLEFAANSLYSVLNAEIVEDNCVAVKLPGDGDLGAIVLNLKELESALGQAVFSPEINGELKVHQWESGSLWLTVCLGSLVAVKLVGSLAWAAAVVYKKINEGRILEEHLRSLEIKNQSLEEVAAAQKKMLKIIVENEARHLQAEFFSDTQDPERTERLKHSIVTLSELIGKGAEIHPALKQPEKANNLFPDFKKLGLVESRIKQIKAQTGE